MKHADDHPTFDFDAPAPLSEWREIPAARFFSWSAAMQLKYCEARDRDAERFALSIEWAAFYRERADGYKEMLT